MFTKIKTKIFKVMLENLLKPILAGFKQKNPKLWLIIAAVLTAAKTAIEYLVTSGIIPEQGIVEWVFWVIALLLGSGGVAAYQFRKELNETTDHQNLTSTGAKITALEDENKKLRELLEKA